MTTFFSYNALLSQRSSGFKNTAYALAEIIDNSFDANASNVQVVLVEKNSGSRRKVEEILVLDDGSGMSKEILQGALQFGNTTNNSIDEIVKKKKKGKFGYGLPNASLSQCTNIGVYSWTKKENVNYVYLNLEELKKDHSIEIPPVEKVKLPDEISSFFDKIPSTGTIISWKNCDRLSHARGETIVRNSADVLGRLYRYLISSGKTITFSIFEHNSKQNKFILQKKENVRANDPLFLLNDTIIATALWDESINGGGTGPEAAYYSKYSISKTECLPTSVALSDHCYKFSFRWKGKNYDFEIKTSVVHPDIQKPGIRDGGSTDVGKFYASKEAVGNISFVRADREIASGHFGGFYNRTELPNRFWSIEVKFDADADDLLGVHNNKQGIEFVAKNRDEEEQEFEEHAADLLHARVHCWILLTQKIASAAKDARALVKRQSNQWDLIHIGPRKPGTKGPTLPVATPGTTTTIKGVEGPRPKRLPEAERKALERRLIEKYPDIPEDEIIAAIDELERPLTRACVLYAPSISKQLWSYTKVFDFVVILINTTHEFYIKVLSELRNNMQEGALTAIELFISSLAIEEEDFVGNDTHKEIIEAFREAVGLKLHRYMRSFPENLSMNYTDNVDNDEAE